MCACARPASGQRGFDRELARHDIKIIEVPPEEYWDLAGQRGHPRARQGDHERGLAVGGQGAEDEGIEVIQVDFAESHRFAIAELHCVTLELVRDQPGPLLD